MSAELFGEASPCHAGRHHMVSNSIEFFCVECGLVHQDPPVDERPAFGHPVSAPVVEEAYFQEYLKKGVGWDQYPETMIRKVAESKALRAAFPDALGGIYEPAEIQE